MVMLTPKPYKQSPTDIYRSLPVLGCPLLGNKWVQSSLKSSYSYGTSFEEYSTSLTSE